MYDEIQQLIAPHTLSSFDYTKIEELLQTYTEEEIILAYKKVGYKPMEYIKKVLANNFAKPHWLEHEIVNEPIDEETIKADIEFQEFIKKFRGYGERKENEGHTLEEE